MSVNDGWGNGGQAYRGRQTGGRAGGGWLDTKGLTVLAGGVLLGVLAGRMMAPMAAQVAGRAKATAGVDPFEALARDHRMVLALLDKMTDTPRSSKAKRAALLLQVKRALTAHALAEEDVVYPVLHDQAHREAETRELYDEHADIKMHLHALEQMPKDDPAWVGTARSLRSLIARHAHQEETVEFPRLRRMLDKQATGKLSGQVSREKAMVM